MLEQVTSAPALIGSTSMLQSQPDRPTVPSKTAVVPSDFHARNHVGVPEASADESLTMASKVATPSVVLSSAVAAKVRVAYLVAPPTAVSAVAGWAPS